MLSNAGASDSGVGRSVLWIRMKLSIKAASTSFACGALPAFLIPLACWFLWASPHEIDVIKSVAIIHVNHSSEPKRWRLRDEGGTRKVVLVQTMDGRKIEYFTSAQFHTLLAKVDGAVIGGFESAFYLAVALGIAGYFLTLYGLMKIGQRAQEKRWQDGSRPVVTDKELDEMVCKQNKSPYRLAKVTLPKHGLTTGIFALGAQGSGKSVAIFDLMDQVFNIGKKSIIYDQSGEFFKAYFRPGKDIFFNPALEGSVAWSIFEELEMTYDSNTLAEAFLPPKGGVHTGSSAFFEDAARAVFSSMLRRLKEKNVVYTSDLSKAILEMPDEEMEKLLAATVAKSAIGGDAKGQRQGVISSMAIYLDGISAVPKGRWSVRKFLENDDDCRLFLLSSARTRAMFDPLYRLILTIAFNFIEAKHESIHEDKYWFFLDEAVSLGDIRLDEQLATLRKYGVCIVAGAQSESQMVSTLGRDRADTVMNCFGTVLLLNQNQPAMLEQAAARLGKMEVETVTSNQALAVTDQRDGAGLSTHAGREFVVSESEIMNLEPNTGYLKTKSFPAAKVDYSDWLKPRLFGLVKPRIEHFAPRIELPPPSDQFFIKSSSQGDDDSGSAFVDKITKVAEDNGDDKVGSLFADKNTKDVEGAGEGRNGLAAVDKNTRDVGVRGDRMDGPAAVDKNTKVVVDIGVRNDGPDISTSHNEVRW